ncbi:type II secretion system protein N [Calothrix sp. PCC 6303]|uniref:type II secretion system protein N n=1 Tax=Calothrix sp. PCC 6303 TaxID=1170562 RepID=UPI0002A01404|nr:type II secretion system protein N [Calothrix sp. PCC 6303]AFZ02404.1 hypothetical protein Cal6303_3471 [Calothrix sp. PCC 6303]
MSTEANTHIAIQQPSEDFIVSEPWSIENYADGLMDELFADIDYILDPKGGLSIPTIEPEFVRLQTVKMSPIVLPKTEVFPVSGSTSVGKQQSKKVPLNNATAYKKNSQSRPKQSPKSHQWFGRLLTLSLTIGVAITGVLFVKNSGLFNNFNYKSVQEAVLTAGSSGQSQPELTNQVDIQADMVNYMLNSLAAIDRQQAKGNFRSGKTVPNGNNVIPASSPSSFNNAIASKLPPPLTANNSSPYTNRTAGVERVYVPIPVYNAPLPMRYAPPSIPGVRSPLPPIPGDSQTASNNLRAPSIKTALNSATKVAKPLNVFAAVRPGLKSIDIQTKPITLRQPKAPTMPIVPFRVVPPSLPVAAAPARQAVKTQSAPEIASAPTAPNHTLEGVIESTNKQKSAALFKISGVSRRVEIGESIGASGWTLVEIANGEAVIRRNGEVRSIYAGQNL